METIRNNVNQESDSSGQNPADKNIDEEEIISDGELEVSVLVGEVSDNTDDQRIYQSQERQVNPVYVSMHEHTNATHNSIML